MVLGMGPHEIIDLSSDEESELANVDVVDVKPNLLSSVNQLKASSRNAIVRPKLEDCSIIDARQNGVQNGSSISPSVPLCRQFWKSGEYEVGQVSGPSSRNGGNRLRIHPKFLHSNATSHKWAFGALAELLDNAVDEVQNGATFVIIDKFNYLQTRDAALLIQDDGGGMGPESLRRCMSFGFSDKQSGSSIGQYGNGFKTSTMRLGADVIVFSRCIKKRALTQSVGLLSYTFLRQTGSDDIVVPVVDYEFDQATGAFERLMPYGEKQFSSNLSTLLKWSPFDTEEELLKQFTDIGHHGTKIVVYNLWFNDEGKLELDFESDAEDIYIRGSHKRAQTTNEIKLLNEKHVANRLHYSLRAYVSILYLQIPEKFKIILRGKVVEHHNIVKDINYLECVKYRPQVGGTTEAEVITFIGFLRGAPNLNVHGFNVYHRNRLILPFWKVANNSYGKGRGVAGVLEANFIKPTHDKQDFEKSTLYQKLETRLKEMTYEYWDYHCHLFGYAHSKVGPPLVPIKQMRRPRACNSAQQGKIKYEVEQDISPSSHQLANKLVVPGSRGPTYSAPRQLTQNIANSRKGLPEKRRDGDHVDGKQALKKQAVGNNNKIQVGHGVGQEKIQEIRSMVQENKKLRSQCLGYEERKKDLLLKERKLRSELQEVQQLYKTLLLELKSMDEVKVEKL